MAVIIKTKEEIEILREGGKRLATILHAVSKAVKPGVTTLELDALAEKLIRDGGDEPAFKGYKPEGHRSAFPASLCTSVNTEVVHGIPKSSTVLKEGDIVSIDLGLKHKGLFTDHALTVAVGNISKKDEQLLRDTRDALYAGIHAIVPGARIGDIGYAVEQLAKKHKYGNVRVLAGHGVGKYIHEDPFIPNYGKKGTGLVLKPGMVIAIEPMFNHGGDDVVVASDHWTFKTADAKRSAHFEHTVLITEYGAEILTEI